MLFLKTASKIQYQFGARKKFESFFLGFHRNCRFPATKVFQGCGNEEATLKQFRLKQIQADELPQAHQKGNEPIFSGPIEKKKTSQKEKIKSNMAQFVVLEIPLKYFFRYFLDCKRAWKRKELP